MISWRMRQALAGRRLEEQPPTTRVEELEDELVSARADIAAARADADRTRDQLTAEHALVIRLRDELAAARRELELCRAHPARYWQRVAAQHERAAALLDDRLAAYEGRPVQGVRPC